MDQSKALGVSLIITLTFGFVEILTGVYANSLALISDAGHMFTDAAALFIAFVGSYLSSKSGNHRMTYGLKRAEALSSFANAIFLIFLLGYVFYESISRLFNPVDILPIPMLSVAFIGLVINLVMAFIFHGHAHESMNLKVAFLHVIFDTIGSISTIIAGILVLFTKTYIADVLVSLALSLLIVPQIYNILKMTVEILLQAAPSHIPIQDLKTRISNLPYVKEVHALHLWSLTPKDCVFTTHVVIDNIKHYEEAINEINSILNEYGIKHVTIQVEEEASLACPIRNLQ